jgi:hypothetical protein
MEYGIGRRFSCDVALSGGAYVLSMLAAIGGLAYIGHAFGEVGLGCLSVVNRTAGGLMPLLIMGGTIFLTREWASPTDRDPAWPTAVLLSVMIIWGGALAALATGALFFADAIKMAMGGTEAFGQTSSVWVVLWVLMCTLGLCLQNTIYCAYRGQRRFGICAFVQIVFSSIPLSVAIFIGRHDHLRLVNAIACSQAAIPCVMLIGLFRSVCHHRVTLPLLVRAAKHSLVFGMPRVPVFFLNYAVYGGPVYILSVMGEQMMALRMSVVLSLIRQGLGLVASFGLVVLPALRQMDPNHSRSISRRVVAWVGPISWSIALPISIAAPWLLRIIFNVSLGDLSLPLVSLMLWGSIGGGLIYEILRNVNDALFERPFNTISAGGAFLCGVGVLAVGGLLRDVIPNVLIMSILAVFVSLGVFTVIGFDLSLALGRIVLIQTGLWCVLAVAIGVVSVANSVRCGLAFAVALGLFAATYGLRTILLPCRSEIRKVERGISGCEWQGYK